MHEPREGREDEKRPALVMGSLGSQPIPKGKQRYRWQQAEIKTYPYPDHVTAKDKRKIEELIQELEWGGRGMMEASEALVAADLYDGESNLTPGDQFRAVGRLISEFKNVLDAFEHDYESEECKARLMVVDRILRRIDGFQPRDFADRKGIRVQATASEVKRVIKRWNWWYDLEKWRWRREPWDPREDLELDPELDTDRTEIVR